MGFFYDSGLTVFGKNLIIVGIHRRGGMKFPELVKAFTGIGRGGLTAMLLERLVVPDVKTFIDVVRRVRRPKRVHFVELFLDDEIKEAVWSRYEGRYNLGRGMTQGDPCYTLKKEMRLHEFLGYDVYRVGIVHKDVFLMKYVNAADTTAIGGQHRGKREWAEEHGGPIQSWKDFETYQWPKVSAVDFGPFEWLDKNLPENMGVYDLTAHILEMLTFLMGYETFCYKVADEPDLVDAILEKVGAFYIDLTKVFCDFRCVPLAWGSDDMGFRTSTLASPSFLRAKIFPWHRKCAEIAHGKGKPYLMHNCGNLTGVMDALIDDVKIDAKHSFEDAIMPVTEAFQRWGKRLAILGGIDVDFLIRSDEGAIRRRVRETLDACVGGGSGSAGGGAGFGTGYCLGTGNTVANYIPVENFLVMLDEGRRYGAA
jgi:uroporphyrinogen decarboxylase